MTLSIPEVTKDILLQDPALMSLLGGSNRPVAAGLGVVIGAATQDEVQNYVVEVAEKGYWKIDLYLPLAKPKIGLLIEGPDLDIVEQIKSILVQQFHYNLAAQQRKLAYQVSTGETWLVHSTQMANGPYQNASPEERQYQQERLTMMLVIGTDPVSGLEPTN